MKYFVILLLYYFGVNAQQPWQRRTLELVNEERAKVGAPPLCLNAKLNKAAIDYSAVLAAHGNILDHNVGGSQADRITQAGFKWDVVGENLADPVPSADQAMFLWMNSEGHRANILNPAFRFLGVGGSTDSLSHTGIWIQEFASGASETCLEATPTPSTALQAAPQNTVAPADASKCRCYPVNDDGNIQLPSPAPTEIASPTEVIPTPEPAPIEEEKPQCGCMDFGVGVDEYSNGVAIVTINDSVYAKGNDMVIVRRNANDINANVEVCRSSDSSKPVCQSVSMEKSLHDVPTNPPTNPADVLGIHVEMNQDQAVNAIFNSNVGPTDLVILQRSPSRISGEQIQIQLCKLVNNSYQCQSSTQPLYKCS